MIYSQSVYLEDRCLIPWTSYSIQTGAGLWKTAANIDPYLEKKYVISACIVKHIHVDLFIVQVFILLIFFKMAFGRFIKTLQSLLIPWYFWVTWILEISIDISALLPVTVGVVVQFGGSLHPLVWLALDTEAPLVEREFLDALPGELLDDNSPSLEFVLSQQQGVDIDPHPNDIGSIVLTLKGTYYTWLSTLGYSTAHKAVKFCVWG